MTQQRRAIIVGGSMGGLFAALALRKRGWHVDIYERNATALSGRGAGIATHERLSRALTAVGIHATAWSGIEIDTRCLYDRAGHIVRDVTYPQLNTSWDALLSLLRSQVPDTCYHLGRTVTDVITQDATAVAHFSDGTSATADLIIAADGIRSSVRACIAPESQPVYSGYVAWRGLVEEMALSNAVRSQAMSCFAFCLPPGEQILGYAVAGRDNQLAPGQRRYNFVWYRPADATVELPRLLTDDTGHRHAMSVPPPLVAKSVIADMRRAAEATLAPIFVEAVAKTDMPFFQPVYDLAVPRMTYGRVVLIGDAAFVARPHVGAGVTKAAEDACALAEALDGRDTATGLAQFDQTRTPIGARIVRQGRDLGARLDQGAAQPTGTIDILRDTASLAFLD
jgi:2-polyprenyl-6-methoxyphenol hydroxylase-like FAD-dependent oxidoreductase